ncbi:MAG: hypothetical protein LBH99_02995 [Rickettsia sp.]|jgi:hypothetical protein|nr:hypothetical protein [Rickettsia sp.]
MSKYVMFCGMSFAGKNEYRQMSVDYLIQERKVAPELISIVDDPKSTEFGEKIVQFDRVEDKINNTVSGALYVSASCNIYDNLISSALENNQYIFCKGGFPEVIGYQGAVCQDQGFSWEMLKKHYTDMVQTTHKTVQFPDIIFICVNSFSRAQIMAKCSNSKSWEAKMTVEEYDHYSNKMRETYKIIAADREFTAKTKVLLIDPMDYTLAKTWESQIKPEIDQLMGLVTETCDF